MAKKPAARMTFDEAMAAMEKAGTAQARKIYARHGAPEPMFGTSFAVLKTLVKRIGVDHELARRLWETRNFDARNLALKIADPAKMTLAELDRWAGDNPIRMSCGYISALAAEGPHGRALADRWLAGPSGPRRTIGWGLVGHLVARDGETKDPWFEDRLATIVKSIHASPDAEKEAMNMAVIAIGSRSPALRKAAVTAAKRIGKVEVDHGETSCKTPDAIPYIEKMWAHSRAKGFESPAAQERARESSRTRC